MSQRSRFLLRVLLLGVMLVVFVSFKQIADNGDRTQIDGFYYRDIAQNLLDGAGFASHVSLYHQGFSYFPHPVNQAPVWILTLAGTARVVGLDAAAKHVPEFFYAVALVLLWLLANRLRRSIGGEAGWLRPDGLPDFGHVAVFLLGANGVFFRFTSLPYTEALGYSLLFAALLSFDRATTQRAYGRSWAAAAGLLTGLALLTRTQFLPALVVLPLALVLCRERRAAGLVAFTVAVAAPFVPWVIWLSTWLEPLTAGSVLGLAALRETDELRAWPHALAAASLWEYAVDRSGGLIVAFNPWHEFSYLRLWGPAAWLVLVAPTWWVFRNSTRLMNFSRSIEARHALPFAMILLGAAMLLPVHMMHGSFFKEWLFAHRHGLPLLLLMLPGLAWLDATGRGPRLVGALLVTTSVVWLSAGLGNALTRRHNDFNPNELKVAAWLDRQVGHPVVITTRPQRMSHLSRNAYFHWMVCKDTTDQTLTLLRMGLADYVMLYEDEGRRCTFASITERTYYMKLVHQSGKGYWRIRIFKLRQKGPATSQPR